MKATELMIGDLIQYNGEILRLYEFSRKYGYFGDGHPLNGILISEIEPIPLTPEILEKNTTESNKNIFGGMNYALDADYFIENRGHRFCLSRLMAGHKYSTFWVCDIHYVHQLQHALKLCNINLEIKL